MLPTIDIYTVTVHGACDNCSNLMTVSTLMGSELRECDQLGSIRQMPCVECAEEVSVTTVGVALYPFVARVEVEQTVNAEDGL